MNARKAVWTVLSGLIASFSVYALDKGSNPASTEYVDAKIAILQAKIDKITHDQMHMTNHSKRILK